MSWKTNNPLNGPILWLNTRHTWFILNHILINWLLRTSRLLYLKILLFLLGKGEFCIWRIWSPGLLLLIVDYMIMPTKFLKLIKGLEAPIAILLYELHVSGEQYLPSLLRLRLFALSWFSHRGKWLDLRRRCWNNKRQKCSCRSCASTPNPIA